MSGAVSDLRGSTAISTHGDTSHTPSGVTPGDYGSLATMSVNAEGSVTLASNTWNTNFTYPANHEVIGSNSRKYVAITSQSGNDPVSDAGVHWRAVATPDRGVTNGHVPIWNSSDGRYEPGAIPTGSGLPVGTDAQMIINDGATPYVAVTIGGDVTVVNTGAFSVNKVKGVSVGLTSWAVTAGRIPVFNGTSLESVPVSGDITLASTGAVVVTKINGNTVPSGAVTGDLLYASASGVFSRLAIGSTSQLLSVAGGIPAWQTMGGDATISAGTLTLKNTGTAGTKGSGSLIPVFVTDAQGRVTSNVDTAIVVAGTNFANQNANIVFAGPSSGAAAAPTFRAQVPLDWAASSATGGIAYSSSATVNAWLPIGSTSQLLSVAGGVPAYQTVSGDITYSAGVTAIGSGKITLAMMKANNLPMVIIDTFGGIDISTTTPTIPEWVVPYADDGASMTFQATRLTVSCIDPTGLSSGSPAVNVQKATNGNAAFSAVSSLLTSNLAITSTTYLATSTGVSAGSASQFSSGDKLRGRMAVAVGGGTLTAVSLLVEAKRTA